MGGRKRKAALARIANLKKGRRQVSDTGVDGDGSVVEPDLTVSACSSPTIASTAASEFVPVVPATIASVPASVSISNISHSTPATSTTASQLYFASLRSIRIASAEPERVDSNSYEVNVADGESAEALRVDSDDVNLSEVRSSNQEAASAETNQNEIQHFTLPTGRRVLSCISLCQAIATISRHAKNCSAMDFNYDREEIVSLQAQISFKCTCGFEVNVSSDSGTETYPINTAIAWGSCNAAVGHYDLVPLLTTLDVPPPSYYTFRKHRDLAESNITDASDKSMRLAAEEEKRLALEAGDTVTLKMPDGSTNTVPSIKVVVDGSWAKRSYTHSFSSSYGAAAIIGSRTSKVLYVGVRVKACYICSRYKGRKIVHNCRKNFSGSATAMEADIIVEGFKKSVESYGLVYSNVVGDGDSSVYSKVIDVYPGIRVEKIECVNHVIRNLNTKLTAISRNALPGKKAPIIPEKDRRFANMSDRFDRVGRDVMGAILHYHKLGNYDVNWKELQDDIRNIPYLFGRHTDCKDYFECSKAKKEKDIVDFMKDRQIFKSLVDALERPAKLAKSLIYRENSNVVESFMAVIAKYIEGKRKNLGGGSLYHLKVASAVMSFNSTSFWAADAFKLQLGRSPAILWKKPQRKRDTLRKNAASRPRKIHPKNLNWHFLKARVGDADYGSDPVKPPMQDAELLLAIENLRVSLQVKKKQQLEIEQATRGQSHSTAWFRYRRTRLTASNAKRIARLMDSTDNAATLRDLLYSNAHGIALDYGRQHENDALRAYELAKRLPVGTVTPCGLFVSCKNGIFAATPDGLVGDDGIVEVKCPFSLQDAKPKDWPSLNKTGSALYANADGSLHLKRDHAYYYQVVVQLHVTERKWCDFVVWTPQEVFIQRITKDANTEALWKTISKKLERFWAEDSAPELVDPQHPNKFRVPKYRADAMEAKKIKLIAKQAQKESKASTSVELGSE